MDKVLIIASFLKTLADTAPGLIKTVDQVKPAAEKIIAMVMGEHVTQEAVNALMAEIESDETKIQAPLS